MIKSAEKECRGSVAKTRVRQLTIRVYMNNMKINAPSVIGGARGVMVIVVRNGHGDSSSNPERD